ncbi:elongation factor P 5-aminopentanone reductase [Peptostreptococcus faecalis]|uniref:elongation factor P 5-aminopentanone reductase n=1 Tax=Peptostreptococcus faecalis TaxID=2045015 RepID=UPI000C7ACC09|nr:SDR family oxidoreductase [Peptostreptococcus faecalis]
MKKIAIVTGGSRGIGKQISIDLAKNNYKVLVNYNKSKSKAEKLKKNLTEKGFDIEIFKADVSKESDVKKLFEYCKECYGSIDLLVNNAGISHEGLITDLSAEEWDSIMNTNLRSVFLCSKEALKIMISNHSGKIINISSMWGVTGGSYEVAYSASKAGIIGFTKGLAKEVGPSGINVNAIAPGVIMTDMMNSFSEEEINDLKEETPLMKVGSAEDISSLVLFLGSEKSNFITGQVIGANGGFVI